MTRIKDVTVPTKGVAKYFDIIALNFPMNPTSVSFYWQIFAGALDEQGNDIPGAQLLDGNLTMDQQTYADWGTNDDYVIDWACDQLGFVIV